MFWCNENDTLSITATPVLSTTVNYYLDYYGPNGLVNDFINVVVVYVAGVQQTTTLNGLGSSYGYFGLHLKSTVTTTLAMSLQNQTFADVFCHLPLANFSSNYQSVIGARILGSSLMFTNTAAVLNLGGEISGYQTAQNEQWMNYVNTNSVFSLVSSLPDAETKNMSQGLFGFLKPTQTEDFDYKTHLALDIAGNIIGSSYPVDSPGSFLVMVGNCTTPAGCLGYTTMCNSIEYQTKDVWRETDYARTSEAEYQAALNVIKTLQQFHENPLHLSELWSGIKRAVGDIASGFIKYGVPIIQTAQTIAKLL
jgi:hypothetical protein